MSEAKAKDAGEGKKKGGKMPVIIAAVVVIGGGGFFMMKKDSGGPKKEPEVKLAHAAEPAGEFLVNLGDGVTYLSTKISVQCAEGKSVSSGGGEHGGSASVSPAVQDAIIEVLTSKRLDEITSVSGKTRLKYELAYAMNEAYKASTHEEEEKKADKKEDKEDKEGKEEKHAPAAHGLAKDFHPEHEDWDADEGPVLKVYFTSFTTQR
jgi:flagellar FliL protein